MRTCFINPNLDGSPIPNLGLAYVISAVEKEHEVKLLDMSFHARDYASYLKKALAQFKPDVVAFSINSFTFSHALKIAPLIRKTSPRIPLVYGGVHPTLLPEETLQNSLVDAICIGEGEDAFKEYLEKLQAGKDPAGVAGIWYKDPSGSIVKNPLRPFRQDLDSLPFPNWDHWDIERYLKTNLYFVGGIGYMYSRGCPYDCAFCSNPALRRAVPGTFYRTRSPENVIEEIKLNRKKYAHRGFRNVAFGDATFGLNAGKLEEFCALYIKEGLHREFPWVCQTRADIVTEGWADQVSRAGCCMVTLGIESGDDYIRTKVYGKVISADAIHNAVERLRKRDIMYAINIMLGCPDETRESVKRTMDFLKWADPINTYFSFYQPLPKTELGEQTKELVVVSADNLTKPWNTPRIAIKNMEIKELKRLMLKIRIVKVAKFFTLGIRFKGLIFLFAVFKYVFSIGGYRTMSLRNPYMEVDMEQRTFYNYLLEHWKKGYLKKIGEDK
ncbi:MAG: radical SAM protein [Candidatus Omnitrophica bacterium]|nr:radical SAM protein [Candidatus Omnitrophota bacterium]